MKKQPKLIEKTGCYGETYLIPNPEYGLRNKMTHLMPKKKKRKK